MVSDDIRLAVNNALDELPENATIEDLLERLYFLVKVQRGLDQANSGDFIPHEEVEKQFLQ